MTDADHRHTLRAGTLLAEIAAQGAELQRLDHGQTPLLWPAGPAWPRHAPVLFPIIGELAHHALRWQGKTYPMPRHGFARSSRFTWGERTPETCTLFLNDSQETLAAYPFPFRLDLTFQLTPHRLTVTHRITNPGDALLPCSLGAHPALRWPLFAGVPKQDHAILFEHPEPAPIRRLDAGGLVLPEPVPTPIQGNRLFLREDLFAADAIILPEPLSHGARLEVPDGRGVTVAWHGFRQLGLWSKAGGDFVCIEPWRGMADPAGFMGNFADKPGLMLIAPGETREMGYSIAVR